MKSKRLHIALVLALSATVLLFLFSGHNYIAYALYFAAALTLLFGIIGKVFKGLIFILLTVGILYFVSVEIPIIGNSSGDENFDADYIIVLGAAVHGDTPSLSLVERMTAARDYLNTHPYCKAVVSGGRGDNENLSEAQAMYDWLTSEGISPERIIMEDKATSTYENIKYSYELIDDSNAKVAVVSSEYHLFRAKLIAGAQGHEVGAVAAHTTYPTVKLNYFIREAFGVTYYMIFG